MSRGRALLLLAFALAGGCSHGGWPEEEGVPAVVSQAENHRSGELFLQILTARRRDALVPGPLVTPQYQLELRRIVDRLQALGASAQAARQFVERWGRTVYRRDVDVWVLDCNAGAGMAVPSALVGPPTVVISFAAARFRRVAAPSEQCALLVVSATGSETVRLDALNQR